MGRLRGLVPDFLPFLNMSTTDSLRKKNLLLLVVDATLVIILVFIAVRTVLHLLTAYHWAERILALALLASELFILTHAVAYFLNVRRCLHRETSPPPPPVPDPSSYPTVAIVVSSYREPLQVVENNLICFRNLTYPNKQIWFLDDTRYDLPGANREAMDAYRDEIDRLCRETGVNLFRRKWHGAKAGMINDFLDHLAGRTREGSVACRWQERMPEDAPRYLIVFDADMNPLPDFVEPLVALMEANPRLAFVQTPQYYTNFEHNRVARASSHQQAIFYEYICEGKGWQDAMFCCGTNVLFRREALEAVGGFDDTSVTEDFATSIKFHATGWGSAYVNKVCAFGMGPQDLGGYFKQQFRWALGTIGCGRDLFLRLFRTPGLLSPVKWAEYLISGSYYLIGWVYFILGICPVLYLFFGVPRHYAYPEIFFLIFVPYMAFCLVAFASPLSVRAYRFRDIAGGMLLSYLSFPVFMKASLLGLAGFRGSFGITPKDGGNSLPLVSLWPQIGMMLLSFAAIVWGGWKLYYGDGPALAVAVNMVWCSYYLLVMSTVFYFNKPEEPDGSTG